MMKSIIEHERKRLILKYSIRFLVVLMISTAAFLISNRSKFRFIAEFEKKTFRCS